MFVGNNFLGQTVSFGICQGVVSSHEKIHCLDPSKQPRALANLWKLTSLAPLSIWVFQPRFARWKTRPNRLGHFSGSWQLYILSIYMDIKEDYLILVVCFRISTIDSRIMGCIVTLCFASAKNIYFIQNYLIFGNCTKRMPNCQISVKKWIHHFTSIYKQLLSWR